MKELKLFQVIGDKIEAPKPVITQAEIPQHDSTATKVYSKKESELIIFGESSDQIKYALAKCCNPIPGDDVFGFFKTFLGFYILSK